jgi:hypothetical protein
MIDFFSVNYQTMLFGWINGPYVLAALLIACAALLTKDRNHIYTWIAVTCFLALFFHFAQFLFIFFTIDWPWFPYLQFGRTVFFVLSGLSALVTLYYIFRSK